MDFFYQHVEALGRPQICLTVQQIFGSSTEGNVINLTRKIPIFFVANHCVIEQNFAMIGIRTCVVFRISRL